MASVLSIALLLPCIISTAHYQDLEGKIVNGIPISASNYPWIVSLRYFAEIESNGTNITVGIPHFCGASLIEIDPPTVMTAAHCVDSFGLQNDGRITESANSSSPTITIALDLNRTIEQRDVTITGLVPIIDPSGPISYETLYVSDANMLYIHPKWNTSSLLDGYDIALFIIDDNQTVSSLTEDELPELQKQLKPFRMELCCDDKEDLTAIGYGNNATDGSLTKTLEMTTLNYIEPSACIEKYFKVIFESINITLDDSTLQGILEDANPTENGFPILCVSGYDTNICQGDSGGPLFAMNGDYAEIKGVTSFTVGGCNDGSFSGFTPVGDYYDWIMKTIDYAVDGDTWNPTNDPTAEPTASPTDDSTDDSYHHFNYVMVVLPSVLYSLFSN
eukprot:CAMPEP_0201579904 /NCGR_PEP_ID=MMETSP0190_2-20130828/27801_1 /ASSEMBLY_ACC=CAM_ASM_000263 /TAXON_ID=37353 /ORGANISM="Rosalina sp." /LENGTH=389 /DNA_ID=CAMNT_0048015009 /DNA_START=51 /DNA_END=1220 /DNA_ORIENTATION=+